MSVIVHYWDDGARGLTACGKSVKRRRAVMVTDYVTCSECLAVLAARAAVPVPLALPHPYAVIIESVGVDVIRFDSEPDALRCYETWCQVALVRACAGPMAVTFVVVMRETKRR